MDPGLIPIDDDREWIQYYIEYDEFIEWESWWWRNNELIAEAMKLERRAESAS